MTVTTIPMSRPLGPARPRSASRPGRLPAAAPPARQSRPARLATRPTAGVYRRRRIVTAMVGGLLVLAGARAADGVVASAGHHVHDTTKVVHYEVQPGDTLWSIAHRLAPHSDPRAVVDLLVQAHGGPTVHPGDVINWAGM